MKKTLRPAAAPSDAKRPRGRPSPNGEVQPDGGEIDEIVEQQETPSSSSRSGLANPVRRKRPEEKGPQQGQGGRPGG